MEPETIQVFRFDDGRYSWEATFADERLNQDGYSASYAGAMACILGAVDNAALPDDIDARIPTFRDDGELVDTTNDDDSDERALLARLPPEGAVE